MNNKHKEQRLEDAIEHQFVEVDRFQKGSSSDFDADRAVESWRVISFIQKTQSKLWESLKAIHGNDTKKIILDDLYKTLETQGMLNVLRYGFKSYGKKSGLLILPPAHN